MWIVMMVAMMLPSLIPMLWRYRQAIARAGETRLGRLTVLVGAGYFFVWAVIGMAVFPLGAAMATVLPQPALARAVPIVGGVAVVIAGAIQFTAWKARRLACCRDVARHLACCQEVARRLACCREAPALGRALPMGAGTAWRDGLRLGLLCSACCANLMVILLVIGVMDLRVMGVVTVAITSERLVPGERIARAVGAVAVGAGLVLISRVTLFAGLTRIANP
jgi:predicted metal-binding membrane protein